MEMCLTLKRESVGEKQRSELKPHTHATTATLCKADFLGSAYTMRCGMDQHLFVVRYLI